MNFNIKSQTRRATALMLVLFMLFTLTACKGKTYKHDEKIKPILPKNAGSNYHSNDNLTSVIKSGLYELLIDEKNFSFALKDTAGTLWTALPDESNKQASLLNLELTDGKKTYSLNSQDNAVAFGKAKAKTLKNGIDFSYVISDKKNSPSFEIPITLKIRLLDGQLTASIDLSKLKKNSELDGFVISSIDILPYFGAITKPLDEDFILIPDGSGGIILPKQAGNTNYEIETYGADYAVEASNKHAGIVPAFGLKKDQGAFAGIVVEGDAISKIHAKTLKNGMDNVYASFSVAPNAFNKKEDGSYKYSLSKKMYDGNISVCYRFISGSAANYAGLASICREQFIREGYLSTRTAGDEDELPLNITLIGGTKNLIIGNSAYTSFENVADIAAVLKAKGIDALNIKYDGAFKGGLNQTSLKKTRLSYKLGSPAEFQELQKYLDAQGFNLYMNLDLITTASSGSKASGILNNSVKINTPNNLIEYLGPNSFKRKGLTSDKLTDSVVKFMTNMKDYGISGYCIDDAGSVLYSDFSDGFVSRQDLASSVFGQVIALSTNKNLMVENGNLYTLKNALIVSEIPTGVSYDETSYYSAIPFAQMILHGTIEYTGDYLNLSKDYNKELLKSIEYGALPAFEWTYNDAIPKGKDKSLLYFENWTAEATSAYETFNAVLGNLRGAKMTDHKKVAEGVFCTEYNNETYIYVNYTDKDVVYNNLTIKANSYLRVN